MQVLKLDQFAGRLNETFNVEMEHGRVPFVLVEARPLSDQVPPELARGPFSLLFRHASAIALPQRIYDMQHSVVGEFGIFLVPVARDGDGFLYQAVFN